jgi:YaiO family outer membrane protein
MHRIKFKYLTLFLLVISFKMVSAQRDTTLSADDLFKQARTAAFDQKNYPLAISLSKKALAEAPDYIEISIFLGRVYTWSNKPDSARTIFTGILDKHPDEEDASFAYGNLEYWGSNLQKALEIVNTGLKYHNQSKDLLLLKVDILTDLKQYKSADTSLSVLLKIDPKNAEAHARADRVADESSKNRISLQYDYIYFDKQFPNPWQVVGLDYYHTFGQSLVIWTLNYANRFNRNGLQYEVDAYPYFSKTFYAYLTAAYSADTVVFPKYKIGASLFANLPKEYEAELGFRDLYFTGPNWIYTASIAKYYKNWWFNFRTYLSPTFGSVAQSYTLSARYYTGGADDFLMLAVGTGVSPDDPRNIALLNNGVNYRLNSDNIQFQYWKTYKLNVFFIILSLENQQYYFQTRGNQFDFGVGYQRRF